MKPYDCIIVGAGHNGLICACYLAKAGKRVLVIERRPIVGGAVCTEEIIPGYRFDVGSSAHIMFRATPIMDELRLADHGLEYIEMDPWAFHPILGAATASHSTAASTGRARASPPSRRATPRPIARSCSSGARSTRGCSRFFSKHQHPARCSPPCSGATSSPRSRKLWSSLDTTRQLMTSYGHLIEETFEHESVRAALTWLAAQSGPDRMKSRRAIFSAGNR